MSLLELASDLASGPLEAPLVLVICPNVPPAACGIADYLAATLTEAARQGVAIIVAHCEPDAFPIPGVRMSVLPAADGRQFVRAVEKLTRDLRPGVVHLQYQPGMYGMATSVCMLPRHLRRSGYAGRIVTTFHDFNVPHVFPKAKPLRPWFLRQLVKHSDVCIITNSLDRRTGTDRFGVKADRMVSIPIGSNFAVPPRSIDNHADFRAGYFGLVTADKGLEAALEAVSIAVRENVDVSFRVIGAWAGTAYVEALQRLADDLGIGERVSFTGKIPAEDAARELSLLDACLLLYDEGVSTRRTSFASAMACGLPTITTAMDLVPEGLQSGHNCFIVPLPQSAADVVPVLVRLAREPELRKTVGAEARVWAEPLAYSRIGARHAEMYKQLTSGEALRPTL